MSTTKLKDKSERWLEDLIRKANEYFDSVQPVDVEVVLEEQPVIVRVPFIRPDEFSELTSCHPPRPGVAVDATLWFGLSGVTRAYPGITILHDGEEDDLYRVRNQEAVYTWPEIYDVLAPEDAQNVRMAVWALHIWEPQQRHAAARAKKEANNG